MSIAPVSAGQINDRAFFWRVPTASLLTALGTSRAGLTQRDAEARLKRFGPNRFDAVQSRPLLTKIATRLLNPLVAILIVAAAVSGFSGDLGSFLIIAAVISFSLTLDIVQEHRASADALRKSVAVHADVLRDGARIALPVNALVPGDIVELRIGDLVPADGIVLDGQALQVNESSMTGEPFPASKSEEPSCTTLLAEASNALFAGTSVVTGHGTMLVVETGFRTRFGAIAAALAAAVPPTALERGVQRLAYLIVRLHRVFDALRLVGTSGCGTAGVAIVSLRRSTRGRFDTGASSDGHDGYAGAWGAANGRAAGDRQAALGYPLLWRDERSLRR